MKTKKLFSNILACVGMVFLVFLSSCKPEEAVDELKNKLHEDPVKAAVSYTHLTLPTTERV